MTTKDQEHARREAYNPPCAEVLVNENVNVLHSCEEFLSNSNNKQQLIKLLAKYFRGECDTLKVMQIRRLSLLHLILPAKNKR